MLCKVYFQDEHRPFWHSCWNSQPKTAWEKCYNLSDEEDELAMATDKLENGDELEVSDPAYDYAA